jgi:hypothetical protein
MHNASSAAAAAANTFTMPDLKLQFHDTKLPVFATRSVIMCIWATAAATREDSPLQLPLKTSSRLLHLLVMPAMQRQHTVCSQPFSASDYNIFFSGLCWQTMSGFTRD